MKILTNIKSRFAMLLTKQYSKTAEIARFSYLNEKGKQVAVVSRLENSKFHMSIREKGVQQ